MRDAGNVIVGTIELVEVLGGLFRRVVPESVVQQMIEGRACKPVNGGLGASGVQPSRIRQTSVQRS